MNRYIITITMFIFVLFGIIAVGVVVRFTIVKPAGFFLPKGRIVQKGIRGNIDGNGTFIVYSKLIYDVQINPIYLNPRLKPQFIQLFSIYTGIPPEKLEERLRGNRWIKLAEVDERQKMELIHLRRYLSLKGFFRRHPQTGYQMGYSIEAPREVRIYPYGNLLEPVLGYYNRYEKEGKEGIEGYYQLYLAPKQDGIIKGYRDVSGNIIYDGSSLTEMAINGSPLHLFINPIVQRRLEQILDDAKQEFNVAEVVAGIMDARSGHLIALASSNRYNPNHIRREDIPRLAPAVIRHLYEPGSVMKPITYAILWENGLIKPGEQIYVHRGRWRPKWRKKPIVDDVPFRYLTPRQIIIHSSNIGITKLVLRIDGPTYYKWLVSFGLNSPTGVDIAQELSGRLQPEMVYRSPNYRSVTAFGYSLMVSFMELLRAYNVFNNGGYLVTPRLANTPAPPPIQILNRGTAQEMLEVLRLVVLKGTGKKGLVPGIFTAGKTGTAHISKGRLGYSFDSYNSSFYGFANDRFGHRYTIGVVFFKLTDPRYFASQTAVPTYQKIVKMMVEEKLLTTDFNSTTLLPPPLE